jgi:hypothetical protein
MKPPVKTLAFLTIFLPLTFVATAQVKTNPSNSIGACVQKVIDDFPNHFNNIVGELIIENPQSTDYQCNLKVNGAEECTITRYSDKKTPVYSWQALMLTTDNFESARRKFRSLYNELNNLNRGSTLLKGSYESPAEEKSFTSVVFSFNPLRGSLEKLRVEINMEAEGMDWRVKVLVYEKVNESEVDSQ